ncbi:MAG: 2-hydroxyacyl-CoA dehydratase [Candidatus Hydrogenedentes bacterium]|nr:2-hydroxyacyl-CoA dehydratase [Candidatus Hydrogenedentota bacterium]
MSDVPRQIALAEWDERYAELTAAGMREPVYGGPLSRHVEDGDFRLLNLRYDNSAASLRLWNFLLSEEDRLHQARAEGKKIVGVMKDLGTVPVMAYSLPNVVAFYPDGAWWIPCVMELSAGLLGIADSLGVDESFCPVRAMLGAFLTETHFPIPDMLTCSVGATCDDFSAIAQRLNSLGYPVLWWEIPCRRRPEPDEPDVRLPGGFLAPGTQVDFVKSELERIRSALESLSGERLEDDKLSAGIREANRVRRLLAELRRLVFTADVCPLPALEMLIAEMLAIHFCSDRGETLAVLTGLIKEVEDRVRAKRGILSSEAVRVFWVNPVADLRVMNLLEECGGRICGTEYLFCHAIDEISVDLPPMEALARVALADLMIGPAADRAERVCSDIRAFGAEAVVVSRIPGASHCATEGEIIRDIVQLKLGIPVVEIEVPPVSDSTLPTLRTRIEVLVGIARERRQKE